MSPPIPFRLMFLSYDTVSIFQIIRSVAVDRRLCEAFEFLVEGMSSVLFHVALKVSCLMFPSTPFVLVDGSRGRINIILPFQEDFPLLLHVL